ncbi:MAG: tRNA (adenosine(37)-N6)-dimethylallyltransferase MiaA [Flavobacteriales bacterium]|jgi:tRNA dimethylallyltransferase|nr:tRNA (adenosine(37)-N6)-dimethylallyltransferase MiaA [Flavobacteriales bacterium]MBK6549200.1 tRNA (adenosine(37)-N6)-dimethylallyltransferase MiaA [Flavobacteriales bacterium]MBK6884220.1 tRNA (adenosine(37)-N6)-dimethylallyltransferase MiaA [Flavobacteriales bacterium]MBK7100601.1 tRNA (adenosine(37)-N6)-dimethylallyltransferase MiaA [Flavobacteriales bacterium]MBK7484342.1 tRNA (adenosine(37)-N6)-dimethylallyltransferase MiaA [Flavobacteriales bacterium]
MSGKGTLVVVGGPTAAGKTPIAVSLAKHFGTEVISADSRQFYHAMRIGTARPTSAELQGVPHHFLGHLDLETTWSAGEFARAAEPVLQDLIHRNGHVILVGGSGLYIDALIKGLDPLHLSDPRIRTVLQERFREEGLSPLVEELRIRDEATWRRIDRQNPHRVIRALEVCLASGRPFSEQRTTPTDRKDLRIVRVAMEWPRAELYARIDRRVDGMMADGLLEEARSLLPYRELNALRTVGYRELFAHFDGEMTLEQAVSAIKQHTRNYAKRQVTWLRREASWTSIPPEPKIAIQLVHGQG